MTIAYIRAIDIPDGATIFVKWADWDGEGEWKQVERVGPRSRLSPYIVAWFMDGTRASMNPNNTVQMQS